MRALIALLLCCSCSYTYVQGGGKSRKAATATLVADLTGVVGTMVAMDQVAFPIEDRPQRIAVMSTLFATAVVFALSAKSVTHTPKRKVTGADCVEEWNRQHATVFSTTPQQKAADQFDDVPWGVLPCDMNATPHPREAW